MIGLSDIFNDDNGTLPQITVPNDQLGGTPGDGSTDDGGTTPQITNPGTQSFAGDGSGGDFSDSDYGGGGSSVVDEDAPQGSAAPSPVFVDNGGFQMPVDPVE